MTIRKMQSQEVRNAFIRSKKMYLHEVKNALIKGNCKQNLLNKRYFEDKSKYLFLCGKVLIKKAETIDKALKNIRKLPNLWKKTKLFARKCKNGIANCRKRLYNNIPKIIKWWKYHHFQKCKTSDCPSVALLDIREPTAQICLQKSKFFANKIVRSAPQSKKISRRGFNSVTV